MGRKKIEPKPNQEKSTRLTFRLPDEYVAAYKVIAAIKRMSLEELGEIAVRDCIQKHKSVILEISKMVE